MVNEGLDQLVRELKSSGKLDSSGRFTLDLQRALAKLEQFRLPGKHDYLLSLVAAATLSGARHFSLRTGPKQLEIEFDGLPFQFSELEALFPGLLDEGTEPRLRELAVGLHAARAHAPLSVQLESGRSRLELKGAQVVLEPCRETRARTRIVIRQRLGQSVVRWWSKGEGEGQLLRERCCYGPLAIQVDGRLVEPPRVSLLSLHRYGTDEEPLRLGVFGAQESQRTGAFHGVSGLAPGGVDPVIRFLVDGVAYPQPTDGFPPGFRAWITSPAWRRDLSLSALVQDEVWQKDLDTLHLSARHLLVEYAESAPFLEPLAPSLLWLLQNEVTAAEALKLFAVDAGGDRVTLRELLSARERYGALFVRLEELQSSSMPGRFPDGTPILYELGSWAMPFLRSQVTSHVQLVGGLERPMPVGAPQPRLVGERYLAEARGQGWHLGLPARPPHPYYRIIRYQGSTLVANDRYAAEDERYEAKDGENLIPNGPEAVIVGEQNVARQLQELYHRLYASNPQGEDLRFAASYLLEALAKATHLAEETLCRPHAGPLLRSAWELLNRPQHKLYGGSRLEELNACLDLDTLIRMAYLPTKDGDHVSAHQLAQEPWPELDLTARELAILRAFLPS